MTLADAVREIKQLDREMTIYARPPWQPTSIAVVASEPNDGSLPSEAEKHGCVYFLEVFIAADFLEDWQSTPAKRPSPEESCSRLINYAENDA
jgi:hypothetical protein